MVCMKLYSHPAAYVIGTIRVIVEDSNVGLRSDLCNPNPHTLHMRLVIELNPKNELH
jgi:hypothetical protein